MQMTFPIILAHGVCRFDQLWSNVLGGLDNCDDESKDMLHYFKGTRSMLVKKGYQVFHAKVPWAAPVDQRAEALRSAVAEILRDSGASKVNIIAHSMGGLDTRHMLFNDRFTGKIHQRIASLTTLSTPHWGSPFADWGVRNLGGVISLAGALGLDIEAFKDLTVAECTRFNRNQAVMDFERACDTAVRFQTYACRQDFISIFGPLKLSFYYIEKEEGDNDGLVSVQSARWEDRYFKGTLENTDHINALGWWDPDQLLANESESELLRRIHGVYAEIAGSLP
jgi:triacylglycerol lipase